jgi:hypothetical protein
MIYTNFNELENKELNEGDKIHFLLIGEKPIKYEILNSEIGVYLNISNSRDFMEIAENEFIFRKLSIIDRYDYVKDIVGYNFKVGKFLEVKDLKDLKKVCLCLYRLIEKYNENTEILYNVTSINDLKDKLENIVEEDKTNKFVFRFYLTYFRDDFKGQFLLLLNNLKIPYTLLEENREQLISVIIDKELKKELKILFKRIMV